MSGSQNRSFCSVPGCSCGAQKYPYLSFHSFPTDPDLRKLWIEAIRRDEGPNFCVKKGSTYVCSRHFPTEDFHIGFSINRLKSGVVPSLFPWNNFTAPSKREFDNELTNKRQPPPSELDRATKAAKMDHDYVAHPPTGALDEALEHIKDLETKLEREALSQSIFSRYCVSDDQIRFYTTFPSERVFRIFWESIAPSASRLLYWTRAQRIGDESFSDPSPTLPLIDEFLIYSFRVAAGMKEQLIADMFNVSIATVNRVTITWANYLFTVLSSINMWISKDKVKASMPARVRKFSPNVRVILDCTEIALETSHKHHTTLKGLIGVAPCGLVTFISPLYNGCISNKVITRISGVLPLLEPGDEVVAGEGFLIEDLLGEVGAKLTVFQHPGQFLPKETEQTNLRLIVEKAVARVKRFHIWDSPVPHTLMGTVNQIWHNCCVLANYQFGLED